MEKIQGLFTRILGKRNSKKRQGKEDCYKTIEKESLEELENIDVLPRISDNRKILEQIFYACYDVVFNGFRSGQKGQECLVVYISDISSPREINDSITEPLKNHEIPQGSWKKPEDILRILPVSASDAIPVRKMSDVAGSILKGYCAVFAEGSSHAAVFSAFADKSRKVGIPNVEPSVKGPQHAFVESLDTNIFLIRSILKSPLLKLERIKTGRLTGTAVVVAYIDGIADKGIVREVKKRISGIDIDAILDSSTVEFLTEDEPLSPFPQMRETERPSICCGELAQGRVAVIVDGSPLVLLLPAVLQDFLGAGEDHYTRFYFATFLRLLRYVVFGVALLGPSVYIAVTTFHQEMIPTPLLITIAQSRAEVPLPAIVEALLMEFTFEILREAGTRLPRVVGSAVTIIGGLVIGQGAVEAGIVSQTMIIVVAITGISAFALPAYNHEISVRLLRFPVMLMSAAFGLFGIIISILIILIHLASLRSFGVPYLAPVAPLTNGDMKDALVRMPIWSEVVRPGFIRHRNTKRMKTDSKPVSPDKDAGES